ncbi:MAG TPA: SdpI family protein [Bacteroidia bacterium]|jgi:uncharacterized membrane protein|nr:SdpI family protein [Bacteroidia bacterium]
MKTLLRNSILVALIIVPYIYLYSIWQQLPNQVPTHFNLSGQADDWSGKNFLFFLPTGLAAFIYLLMLALPYIDPKKKIQQMGKKYSSLQFILTFFFSFLSMYLLYISKAGSMQNPNFLIAFMGIMFVLFGNYFQALRPNYFIGIRTPWALENEQVWKKTHSLAGRLWMAGGILITLLSFIISNNSALTIVFTSILLVMVLIPVVFSYTQFKKEKNLLNQ